MPNERDCALGATYTSTMLSNLLRLTQVSVTLAFYDHNLPINLVRALGPYYRVMPLQIRRRSNTLINHPAVWQSKWDFLREAFQSLRVLCWL
jgi:hypothetical protein